MLAIAVFVCGLLLGIMFRVYLENKDMSFLAGILPFGLIVFVLWGYFNFEGMSVVIPIAHVVGFLITSLPIKWPKVKNPRIFGRDLF